MSEWKRNIRKENSKNALLIEKIELWFKTHRCLSIENYDFLKLINKQHINKII